MYIFTLHSDALRQKQKGGKQKGGNVTGFAYLSQTTPTAEKRTDQHAS